MVNYSYGKIYMITSEKTGLVYYGSTAEKYLSQRLGKHLSQYKQYLNGKYHYNSSFELLKCEDYKMELIKDFPCNNKTQLTTEEGKYIRENECVNIHIAGRTPKEWYEDNKEKFKEYLKEYRQDNKEHIKERMKKYCEDNKEQEKKYREDNKEKIKEQKSRPYTCECGSTIIWGNKAIHFKTKKHCQFINNL